MKHGARNSLTAKVTGIKQGDLMSQVSFEIPAKSAMSSVMTVDSLEELDLKEGDTVKLIVKAIHVLVAKE